MTGWKTRTAGALAIVYGVLGVLLKLHGADEGMQFVINGLGLLGIGHKLDKVGAKATPTGLGG